jgi:hypothetical protein
MRVVTLTDDFYEYLVHVLEQYAGRGIRPEEGHAIAGLWESVAKAQHIDDEAIAKLAHAASPAGQSPVPDTELTGQQDKNPTTFGGQ